MCVYKIVDWIEINRNVSIDYINFLSLLTFWLVFLFCYSVYKVVWFVFELNDRWFFGSICKYIGFLV